MSFLHLWKQHKPTLSFEYYPARNDAAKTKLEEAIEQLYTFHPDFVSVTFGACGSSMDGSKELLGKLLQSKKSAVVGYIAAYGLSPETLRTVMMEYERLGATALFCVRGDKPEETENFSAHPQSFQHASQLVEHAKKNVTCPLGVAGYPEGHIESESLQKDLQYLKQKIDAGAHFIITQYFYDNSYFFEYVKKVRSMGITVPILAGIMPIFSIKISKNLATRCGTRLPQHILDKFKTFDPQDKKGIEDFGVELAISQCRELLKSGIDGLHFYTMDRSSSVTRILADLKNENLLT